jgi:hypothetical protein
MLAASIPGRSFGKVVLQIAVDKDIAAACALDEATVFGGLEEGDEVPGDLLGAVEDEAEDKVLDAGESSTNGECSQDRHYDDTADNRISDRPIHNHRQGVGEKEIEQNRKP